MMSSALFVAVGALCLSSICGVDARESFRGRGGESLGSAEHAANLSFLDEAADANATANASAASLAVAKLHVGLRQIWDACMTPKGRSEEFGTYGKEGATDLVNCVSEMKLFRKMANDHLTESIGANDQYRVELDKTQKILQDIVHHNQLLKDAVKKDHENALASLGFTVEAINQRIEGIKNGGIGVIDLHPGNESAGLDSDENSTGGGVLLRAANDVGSNQQAAPNVEPLSMGGNVHDDDDESLGGDLRIKKGTQDGPGKSLAEQRAAAVGREMTVQASGRQRARPHQALRPREFKFSPRPRQRQAP